MRVECASKSKSLHASEAGTKLQSKLSFYQAKAKAKRIKTTLAINKHSYTDSEADSLTNPMQYAAEVIAQNKVRVKSTKAPTTPKVAKPPKTSPATCRAIIVKVIGKKGGSNGVLRRTSAVCAGVYHLLNAAAVAAVRKTTSSSDRSSQSHPVYYRNNSKTKVFLYYYDGQKRNEWLGRIVLF